jgi:hypothetical protein
VSTSGAEFSRAKFKAQSSKNLQSPTPKAVSIESVLVGLVATTSDHLIFNPGVSLEL